MIKIREEGRDGLQFANSKDGIIVSACKAEGKAKYSCPFCGISMHLTHSKNGSAYFACDSGCKHTERACMSIHDTAGRVFKGSPEDTIRSFCVPPVPKNSTGTADHNSASSTAEDDSASTSTTSTIKSFSSLKQICDQGLPHMAPESKIDGCDYPISSYLLSYRGFEKHLSGANDDLGARIIYARTEWFDYNNHSIRFVVFSKTSAANGKQRVRFLLKFPNASASTFTKYRNEIKKTEVIDGKSKPKQLGRDALIASLRWKNLPDCYKNCNKDKCATCAGMYEATYQSQKQIYFVPNGKE